MAKQDNNFQRLHIGIDPGLKYACALMRTIRNQKTSIILCDTLQKTNIELRAVLSTSKDVSCINAWIEDVGAIPYLKVDKVTGKKVMTSQKGSSNFKFGASTGWFYGFFAAYGIDLKTVKPKTWLHEFNVPPRAKPSDIPYLPIARDMFPDLTAQGEFKFKYSHDKAAALLICEYGRRVQCGELRGRKIERINTIYEYDQIDRL